MSSQLQVSGEAKIRDIQGPVVANSGVITALDGAASQYVRGDGTLADFPTSSGGGSSVSYYLNSSVSQGTIGGVAYRELSKEPIIGAGTDIAISTTGYVASYLTDANDPDVILIPGGNFNCEFYFSVNNNTGNPFFYAELYKYDGTTFTLLGSSVGVPEYITQGTVINPYYFAIPVATAALALTDRLAIRIYVNVDGRTVTLHTENGHLCQVVTTLSKGMVSLNNLTDQSQFITTGTSGTNFNIVSSGDTHTFNLPIASATNTGKLSSTDWSVFNAKEPAITAGTTLQYYRGDKTFQTLDTTAVIEATNLYFTDARARLAISLTTTNTSGAATYNNTTGVLNIPDYSANTTNFVTIGTTQTITGTKTFNEAIRNESGLLLKNGVLSGLVGYTSLAGITNGLNVQLSGSSNAQSLIFQSAASYSYTFPASSGTLALASDLSSYVPTSRTLTINGETYDLSANRSWTITGITGSGTSGQVPYFDGPTSLTSEAGFIYDASTNRLGVNTSVPNATIGADAALNSGYGLLIKTGASNYNGIGIAIDSTYGNTIETAKLGTASARNLTLLNQSGFVSLTESGAFGVGILTPNNGIDIYNSTQSQLWLHNAASGLTSTDGVRLALFNNLSANLRNFDGGLSLTAEGDFQIITIGAENLRVNSANGFIGIGNPATLTSLLTVNGSITQSVTSALLKTNASGTIVAAVAGTDYVTPSGLSGYVPTSRTITINGTSQSLVADSSYTVGTLRGNGVSGRIPFYNGTQTFSNTENFIWDDVNGYFGVNNTPQVPVDALGAGFNVSGTTMNIVARFLKDKSSTFKGIGLGYDTSSQTGIIYADTATTSIPSNIAFWTLGSGVYTEKMRITGAGNVGIANTAPNTSYDAGSWFTGNGLVVGNISSVSGIQINSSTTSTLSAIRFGDGDGANNLYDQGFIIYNHSVDRMTLGANRSSIMHLVGGNVGIGTTSPEGKLTVQGTSAQPPTSGTTANSLLQLVGSLGNQLNIGSNTVAGDYGSYIQSSDNNLAVPYPLNLQPNGGNVGISQNTPSALLHLGVANAAVDGTKGVKITNPAGTTVMLECGVSSDSFVGTTSASDFSLRTGNSPRMTITSGGNVGIGTTGPNCKLQVSEGQIGVGSSGSGGNGLYLFINNALSDNSYLSRGSAGSGTTTWYIGNQSITTSSDIRLKENINNTTRVATEIINKIRIVDHSWNDPSDTCINNKNSRGLWMGLIAQEAIEHIPWLVNKPLEDENKDGSKNYWHMDYAYSVPLLMKAIQELNQKGQEQQAQIEELKELIKNK